MISNIFTNGTLISKADVDRLVSLGNIRTVFISLDDIIEDDHDCFRGVKGAFASTIRAINALKDTNIKVVANITLSPHNIDRIDKIISYCRETLGIECRTAPILYVGRGKCFEENNLTLDQIKKAMDMSLKDKLRLTDGFCDENTMDVNMEPGCGVGHKMIYIRANGEICLCPTLSSRECKDFCLGNIYRDDLKRVWNENEMLKEFRNSTCENNECKYLNICKGGCRSRAFLNSGMLTGRDPIICNYFSIN